MAKIGSALLSRWVLSFVGTALLGGLVWVFGPFVPALEGVLARALIILALVALWAGVNVWIDWRSRKREAVLAKGVTADDPASVAVAEETAALREKLSEALALLRQARGRRGYLYEQPWYVIIGPPGAGKTTALLNSGLSFPLAEELGRGAVAGVGGTRLCDWWFTDDAVLIDTAGRYTTQDSDANVDRAGWNSFLELLKTTRPRQPLNGVIVAIAVPDVVEGSREERLLHAGAIRRRLKELRDRLGVHLPVYALFTKADLVAGFCEFFDDLDREKRAQVWGMTFPFERAPGGAAGGFAAGFRGLIERLDARVLERLQAERSADRRALIAGFPAQVASLAAPLSEFLEAAFGGSRLDPAPLLRGVYLASGTQEGTPIDRLTGTLARAFGIDQRRVPSLRAEHGRGYFLARLLKRVVLGEAMLVSEPPAMARRRRLARSASYAAVLLAVLTAGGWLWRARAAGEAAIAEAATALDKYQTAASQLPLGTVTDGDLNAVLPLLDQARALAPAGDASVAPGMSQRGKLAAAGQNVYRAVLGRVLLPRLVWRLESQMRDALDRPAFLYEATRVYLMLGGAGPLDPDLVRGWMRLDWEREYPGAGGAALRDRLALHLDALLAQPLPLIALDGALVEKARATFSRVSLAERVYSRIVASPAAQGLAAWSPADALGAAGLQLFRRGSGKPLSEGVPGLFTVAGFHEVLLPTLPEAAKQVAAESWVLGRAREQATTEPALQSLEAGVVQLYEADYARQWDALLADLDVKPASNLQRAAQDLYVLGSPQSPMQSLLGAITRELTLSVPPKAAVGAAGSAVQKVAATAQTTASGVAAELQRVLGQPAAAPAAPAGQEIDARYQALRNYAGSGAGAGAPMALALQAINGLQQELAQQASLPPGGGTTAPPANDPLLALRAVAAQAPMPVQRWLLGLAESGAALHAGGTRQQAAAALSGAGGPAQLCEKAVAGRYPFVPTAASDVPLEDFTRLFAPGGLIDGFFASALRPFANTTGPVWKAQVVAGTPAPITTSELAPFQRAAKIRDAFFPAGATAPSVHFTITPSELDANAKQVTLDLGDSSLSYAHGPQRPVQVTWPGQGAATARLVFDPPAANGAVLPASGPWALFRLFARGRLEAQGGSDSYTLTFQEGERRVVFAIRTGSVVTPLSPGLLQGFRCPAIR